jgi:hypothetical protein
VVRHSIFEEPEFEIIPKYQNQTRGTNRQFLQCYHVVEEEDPVEENSCNIQITYIKGEREVKVPKLDS